MTLKAYKEVMDLINDIDRLSFNSALDEITKLKSYLDMIQSKKNQIKEILGDEVRETN
jgi:hypothetical protein